MLDLLTSWLQPWADLFAESTWLSTALITVHVMAMFLGGGVAVGADRQVITGHGEPALLGHLAGSHRWVITALVVTNLSGLALATADLATYATSWVFWAKMTTLLALLGNGVRMRQLEQRLEALVGSQPEAGPPADEVQALRRSAIGSLAGWLLIVVLGVVLSNG